MMPRHSTDPELAARQVWIVDHRGACRTHPGPAGDRGWGSVAAGPRLPGSGGRRGRAPVLLRPGAPREGLTRRCRTVRPCTSHTARTTFLAQSSASWARGRWARASPRSRSKRATRSCCTTSTRRRSSLVMAGILETGERRARCPLAGGDRAGVRTPRPVDAAARRRPDDGPDEPFGRLPLAVGGVHVGPPRAARGDVVTAIAGPRGRRGGRPGCPGRRGRPGDPGDLDRRSRDRRAGRGGRRRRSGSTCCRRSWAAPRSTRSVRPSRSGWPASGARSRCASASPSRGRPTGSRNGDGAISRSRGSPRRATTRARTAVRRNVADGQPVRPDAVPLGSLLPVLPPAVRGVQARSDIGLSYREAVHEPHGTDDLAGAVIGVVGAGTMGAGIAQVALEAGHEVVLYDVDERRSSEGSSGFASASGGARRSSSSTRIRSTSGSTVGSRTCGPRSRSTRSPRRPTSSSRRPSRTSTSSGRSSARSTGRRRRTRSSRRTRARCRWRRSRSRRAGRSTCSGSTSSTRPR